MSGWLDLFCDQLGSTLIFPRKKKDFINIEHQEIKDTEFLKEAMSKALDAEMKKVEQNCLSKNLWRNDSWNPENALSEHLCGCWKQCPFYKAICMNTIPTHEETTVFSFNRPQAIMIEVSTTDHFFIDYCTSLVASDCNFILNDGRRILYKTYWQAKGEYATWSITPDTSTQPYWKCRSSPDQRKKYHQNLSIKVKFLMPGRKAQSRMCLMTWKNTHDKSSSI